VRGTDRSRTSITEFKDEVGCFGLLPGMLNGAHGDGSNSAFHLSS